jgi:hypothetical protein
MATTRKPTKPKSSAEMKLQLEAARKRLADLEKRAYAEELTELINSTNIVADFAKIQAKVKSIKPPAILAAIGVAVGIKRLVVTQTEPKPRAPADPNKPKKPRTKKTAGK